MDRVKEIRPYTNAIRVMLFQVGSIYIGSIDTCCLLSSLTDL